MKCLHQIDLHRLAGVRQILGIDLTDARAHIVALERRGNPFNKFRERFCACRSLTVEFSPQDTEQDRASKLRKSLKKANLAGRLAVSSIQTLGVKVVTATIPASVESVDEWIKENYEKLLKFPLPIHEVSFRFEIVRASATSIIAEIAFVRISDMVHCMHFFQSAGIELAALGYGDRDALNAFLMSALSAKSTQSEFVFFGPSVLSITSVDRGIRSDTKRYARSADQDSMLAFRHRAQKEIIISGEFDAGYDESSFQKLSPFGFTPRYTLAAGLAIKGFLPEVSMTNFLGSSETEKITTFLHRSLFQRTALVLGSLIIVLLGTQLIIASLIQSKIEVIDDQLLKSGESYAEVASLEQQVKNLESKLEDNGSSLQRSSLAKVLHDIAGVVPEKLWFSKLTLIDRQPKGLTISITGYARSADEIGTFLRSLQSKVGCSQVSILKSGSAEELQASNQSPRNKVGPIGFEVSAYLDRVSSI